MRVYRYESQSGYGPYTYDNPDLPGARWSTGDGDPANEFVEMWAAHDYDDDHPVAWATFNGDGLSEYDPIACPSMEALNKWFDGFHEMLARNGFKVVVYEVPDKAVTMGHSGKQLSFNRNKARKITDQVEKEMAIKYV